MSIPFFCIQEGLGERVIFDFKSSDLQKEQHNNYLRRNTNFQHGFQQKINNKHATTKQTANNVRIPCVKDADGTFNGPTFYAVTRAAISSNQVRLIQWV